ncbi:MAG TPA: aldose 1-epimerase [Solirubrobacteraceae bacterium]
MAGQASVRPTDVDGYAGLTLASPDDVVEATFLPQLGMVGCSLLHRGEELLERRGGPTAYAERGSSFGIPLLHPWANRLSGWEYTAAGRRVQIDHGSPLAHVDGATGLPMHGLLSASPDWIVTHAAVAADSRVAELRAELDFAADPARLAAFPFPHRLSFHAGVGASGLTVGLTLTPTGTQPVPISFGFHPYVRLPGSARRTWSVELPVLRRAVLDDRGIPTGADEALDERELSGRLADRGFDDSFDRLGPSPAHRPLAFSVADDRRRVSVEFLSGYTVAHVFAPAAADFVCFEPMTAPVDALTSGRGLGWVDPGGSFTAEFAFSVTGI